MTNEEARKIIYDQWQAFLENYIDYGGISEAYKMAIKSLEKDIPKKPISKPDGFGLIIKLCPNCETPVYDPDWTISTKKVYFTRRCQNCGQLFTKLGKYIGTWEDDE